MSVAIPALTGSLCVCLGIIMAMVVITWLDKRRK